MMTSEPIPGCLLGGAVGDSMGLPSEGISRQRLSRLWKGEWKQRLIFGKGMFSDDTEHALMTAGALLRHPTDKVAFQHCLAWKLRGWLAALPAGVGMATAKAVVRLWFGVHPDRSGVASAGNGPMMRSAIIGVKFHEDASSRREFTLASCRLTHTDPRAEEAALLVAEAASLAATGADTEASLQALKQMIASSEMRSRFTALVEGLRQGDEVTRYAAAIGCGDGVSGFAPNTVAIALYAWLRHRGNFRLSMISALNCGGDTDSVGAVLGGIMGAESGAAGIPPDWMDDIWDWPRSIRHIRELARQMTADHPSEPPLFWPGILMRNMIFLLIVLGHGFRRLLPPY